MHWFSKSLGSKREIMLITPSCHVSHVTCHMSHVFFHILPNYFFIFLFFFISRIRETPNPLIDADNSTNICLGEKKIYISIRNDSLFLRLYESVHKCTSRTPSTQGPFMGAIWNNSSLLRLYESVDECTSSLVEHLQHMADPCMQPRTIPCF